MDFCLSRGSIVSGQKGNMRSEAPGTAESKPERERFSDLLLRLATASAGLIRDEIDLAKQEIREKARALRAGIILIAIAVVLGTIALLTLDASLVFAMGKAIGYDLSALIVGIAVAIIALILAGLGIKRISLKPTNRNLERTRNLPS